MIATASGQSVQEHLEFQGFAAAFNWSYLDVDDMSAGMANFAVNKARVQKLNEENESVSFAINASANLNDAQWAKIAAGGRVPNGVQSGAQSNSAREENSKGRNLSEVKSIDWAAAGKVHPVKDQGNACGASWAFSATLVQESMEAI